MKKGTQSVATGEERVIPLAREEVKIGKRSRVTGITRVSKIVHEDTRVVDEPLLEEHVVVERIPVNEFIDQPRGVSTRAGTTVIPVIEEVLVVEKKLLLKEEVRITKQSRTVHKPQTLVLKREEAIVERTEGTEAGTAEQPSTAAEKRR